MPSARGVGVVMIRSLRAACGQPPGNRNITAIHANACELWDRGNAEQIYGFGTAETRNSSGCARDRVNRQWKHIMDRIWVVAALIVAGCASGPPFIQSRRWPCKPPSAAQFEFNCPPRRRSSCRRK
jgi:hypothetical protein